MLQQHYYSIVQLTNQTYGDAVAMLSNIVVFTENNTAEQTSEVLSQVATYFEELADFVNEFNVIINMTVSMYNKRWYYIINKEEYTKLWYVSSALHLRDGFVMYVL